MKKFLICGFGSIGKKHYQVLKSIDKEFSIALFRSGLGPSYESSYLISKTFEDIQMAMNWCPDAVLITSPASCHLDQAKNISKYNIPIFIEKPLGRDTDCLNEWSLLDNQIVLLGYVLRHDDGYKLLKDLLSENYFGKILDVSITCKSWLPDWRPKQDYKKTVSSIKELGGGILLEMSHEIDLMESLFHPIEIISSKVSNSGLLDIDVEDNAIFIAKASNNINIKVNIDFCSTSLERYIKIKGNNGEATWNISEGKFNMSNISNHKTEINLPVDPLVRLRNQLIHFIDCCKGHSLPIVSIKDGIKVLEHIKTIRSLNL